MVKNSKKPRLRFKGFTDEWEQRKVSNMFKVTRGYVLAATLTSVDQSAEFPYPVFSSQTKDNGLMGYYKDYLYEDAITWTTDGANAGTVNFRTGKFYCTNVCGVLLSNDVKASYAIAEALNRVAKRYVSYVGNPKLMNNVMSNIEIYISIAQSEQEKISQLFITLDNLITLHQRKYDKLLNVKKALLDKMFPKNQEKTPKIRFKGFFDAWEQRKVGEISRSYSGGTPIVSNKNYYIGDIPFIRSGEINSENTEFFINELALQNSSAKMIDKGDILYALYGATSGEVARSKLKGAINQAILAIKPISGYDYEFIAQWLRVRKNFIVDKYLQGGQGNLSGEIIKGLQILLPNLIEQQLVGCLFNNLDNLITLHQRKCEKLKNIKKALLDKMFV